jgi:hypothetical protein
MWNTAHRRETLRLPAEDDGHAGHPWADAHDDRADAPDGQARASDACADAGNDHATGLPNVRHRRRNPEGRAATAYAYRERTGNFEAIAPACGAP